MLVERLRFDQRGYVTEDDGARREESDVEFAAHLAARVFPDPTIYREPAERMRLRFAIEAWARAIRERYECEETLECGGKCCRLKTHEPPCLCAGDTDGPGSCPA